MELRLFVFGFELEFLRIYGGSFFKPDRWVREKVFHSREIVRYIWEDVSCFLRFCKMSILLESNVISAHYNDDESMVLKLLY